MKKSKIKQYEKILRKDEDFDFGYLLELERFKLKRMVKSFEEASVRHEGIEHTISELKMCVKLLDIIMEDDAASKMYNEAYMKVNLFEAKPLGEGRYELVKTDEIPPKFPVHINTNNAARFDRYWNTHNDELKETLKIEIRRIKALRLYNKLRNRCFKWWW
jgi:hypothetical protein